MTSDELSKNLVPCLWHWDCDTEVVEKGCDGEALEGPKNCVAKVVAMVEHSAYRYQEDELYKECGLPKGDVEVGEVVEYKEGEEGALSCISTWERTVRLL